MFQKNGISHRTSLSMPAAALLMAAVMVFTIGSSKALAERGCKPVHGLFQSQLVDPSCTESPVGFCTRGTIIGGIQGTFTFTAARFIPSEDPAISSVTLFVGQSVIRTKQDGDLLIGTDTGALDTDPAGDGHFASLITFTGGTGSFEEASGHIVLSGNANFAMGINVGDYAGELCTP